MKRLNTTNVRLELDGLARARYERARTAYGSVAKAEGSLGEKAGEPAPYLTRDIFAGINDPSLKPDAQTDGNPIRRVADWCMGELGKLPEWRQLAQSARGNTTASAIAAEAVTRHLTTLEWPEIEEGSQPGQMSRDNAGSPETFEAWADGETAHVRRTKNGKASTSSKKFGSAEAAQRRVASEIAKAKAQGFADSPEGAQGAYSDRLEQFAQSLEASGPGWRAEAGAMIAAASAEAEAIESAFALTYGLEDEGFDVAEDPDNEAGELARAIREDRSLREFIDSVGGFLHAMRTSPKRRMVRGEAVPYSIEATRNVARLLPMELALLTHPATRAYQAHRVSAGQALGYNLADMSMTDRGPVCVALDVSGSMGGSITIAAAFAAASALHAAESGRGVTVYAFNTRLMELAADLSTGAQRSKFLLRMFRLRAGGGTSFVPLFERFADLPEFPDLLLVSDGCGDLREEFTRELFSGGHRDLFYLVIGSLYSVDPVLRELSAGKAITVGDLLSGAAVDFAASATSAV